MKVGDKVNLSLEEDRIAVTPEKNFTIEALLKDYTGPKPQEYNWGAPMGKELW